ncbi:CAMP factor family pore-forming toxin [Aerococcus mictus]|uniref:CAMP factor family pore-forming toxin n=1 Tax=Aerococcus mictus TaxID=2976810 RepID=UPI0018A72F2E|nr:CAMP factor family pore-forming toxin [Aerococcus mictus]
MSQSTTQLHILLSRKVSKGALSLAFGMTLLFASQEAVLAAEIDQVESNQTAEQSLVIPEQQGQDHDAVVEESQTIESEAETETALPEAEIKALEEELAEKAAEAPLEYQEEVSPAKSEELGHHEEVSESKELSPERSTNKEESSPVEDSEKDFDKTSQKAEKDEKEETEAIDEEATGKDKQAVKVEKVDDDYKQVNPEKGLASEEQAIDFAALENFAKENPAGFNKVLSVAIAVSVQDEDRATSEEVLKTLGEVLVDNELNHELLVELSKFVIRYGELGPDESDVHHIVEGQPSVSRASGFSFYAAGEDKPAVSFEDFEKLVAKVTGTTDSVLSLLENLQKGERPAAGIGAIMDSILPVNLNFTKIGELIQRIAELKAEAVRQDVYLSTEVVGAIAELIPSEVTFNGTPVNYVLDKLGQMALDIGRSVADGMVLSYHPGSFYNPNTFRLRAQVLRKGAELIKTATTEWRMKPQIVHSKAGLEITHAFMSVVDPFSTAERLTKRLNELEALEVFGNAYRNITPKDIATTYIKEKLDKAIWDTRFKRDEYILSKVPFDVYHKLNKAITRAVGVQLYSETRVYQIDDAVAELQAAYGDALAYLESIPADQQIAPNALKRELKDLIWNTRFERDGSILGNVPTEVYTALNATLTKAVGLQLDLHAKTVDVKAAMEEIKAQLGEAREIAQATLNARASKERKLELRDLIGEVRSIRDSELLGKVSFNAYNHLNQVITKAVGTRLNLKASNAEVDEAANALRQALATARAELA